MRRRGFALLAVLWVIALGTVLGLAATLSAREMVGVARNRALLARGLWLAEGCAALARALMDSALTDAGAWDRLDEAIAGRSFGGCDVRLAPTGARLDVNAATSEQLDRVFATLGVEPGRRDSLVAALLDWRDPDDQPRPAGAERDWYDAEHRFLPRNGPLADVVELRRVRGFDALDGLDSLLGTEPGRTALTFAPLGVLASLPGAGPELIAALVAARARRARLTQLSQLAELVSGPPRDSLLARFGDLVTAATTSPDAWILCVAAPGAPVAPAVTVELRLVLAGNRAAVVRRRGW